jgi:hypothetical protein
MRLQRTLRDSPNRENTPTRIRGGKIMVRYFFAWTPLVVVGTVILLSLPWLGLIALMIAALAALAAIAALVWAIVAAPLAVGRAIGHRWHARSPAPQPSPAVLLAERRRSWLG